MRGVAENEKGDFTKWRTEGDCFQNIFTSVYSLDSHSKGLQPESVLRFSEKEIEAQKGSVAQGRAELRDKYTTCLVFPWLLLFLPGHAGVRMEEEVAEVLRNQRDLKDS